MSTKAKGPSFESDNRALLRAANHVSEIADRSQYPAGDQREHALRVIAVALRQIATANSIDATETLQSARKVALTGGKR